MALGHIFGLPRVGRRRGKEEVIALADRARDARQWELACELYKEALDSNPRNPTIWVQYGHALKEWGELRDPGKLAQAETAYRRALALDAGVADTYLQLGHVLKLQGRHEEAKACYLRTFASDPSMRNPLDELRSLGWSAAQFGELNGLIGSGPPPRAHSDGRVDTAPSQPGVVGTPRTAAFRRTPRLIDSLQREPWSSSTGAQPTKALRQADDILAFAPRTQTDEVAVPAAVASEVDVRPTAHRRVQVPDLFELRALKPYGRIAVVLHLFDPNLWGEMREAIERISHPFDLFVSLTIGSSDHLRQVIKDSFPSALVFDFQNCGRDIGPFIVFLQSGVLFHYELVCKLHTKRSPHLPNGDAWRRVLIDGVLGSSRLIDKIIARFGDDPDLGMVVADGNIFSGHECWAGTEKLLAGLLPRVGISPDVRDRSFPGGSIFWIRSFLLRTLAGVGIDCQDFDPEPLKEDGGLGHAVERMFGLICEDAGMRVLESGRLAEAVQRSAQAFSTVHLTAFYLPQFHPIRENDVWWGTGFTEWTNVTKAKPLFPNHRQPRLPSDLGFYDLRLAEVREAQAEIARRYGLAAFCYYYYWFNGRQVLERPLNEVLASGKPDFPFLIFWANEPWSRNWDGLNQAVLLPQRYEPDWASRFARDVAPLMRDKRYFRFDGKPMLLIYRVGHIPEAAEAMLDLRRTLSAEGIPEVHIAGAWVTFPEDAELPADPAALGLDAYFEFPPHRTVRRPPQPLPSGLPEELGGLYDYNYTAAAALAQLTEGPQQAMRHRGVMAGWDNTARMGARAQVFHGATPANFRRWLRDTVIHERRQDGERVIFINAWNEWAEGTYIEPDRDFGHGWLEAVLSASR
jgi:lipopolysaccharide biosynthesis protein